LRRPSSLSEIAEGHSRSLEFKLQVVLFSHKLELELCTLGSLDGPAKEADLLLNT
jgi:hypothetical protein